MQKSDDEKLIFFDKRDENYIELNAYHCFYELFTNDDRKCTGISIPETTLITNGGLKAWLFNSKQDPKIPILKKKQEKLTPPELINAYLKNDPKGLLSKRLSRGGSRSKRSNGPIAYVIYVNNMSDLFNEEQFYEYATDLLQNIKLIQKPLNIVSKADNYSNEIILCEYRKDNINLPASFKVYKKLHEYSKGEKNIVSKQYKPKLLYKSNRKYSDDDQGAEGGGLTNFVQNYDRTKIYKSYDTALNTQMEHICHYYAISIGGIQKNNNPDYQLTKTLLEFINGIYKIDVKKLVVKYNIDADGIFYFAGIKQFYFIFKEGLYTHEGTQNTKMNLNELNQINKAIMKKLQSLEGNIAKKIQNAKFVMEKCHGDFCDYVSFDSLILQGHDIKNGLNKKVKKKKDAEDEEAGGGQERKLPYEISYNLIKKVKEHIPEVKEIFKKNRIFPHAQAELYQDTQIPAEFDIEINIKKSEHDSFQTLYRFVKICKNCYPVYTCILKTLFPSQEKITRQTINTLTTTNKSLIGALDEQIKTQKKDTETTISQLKSLTRIKSGNSMTSEVKLQTFLQKNTHSLMDMSLKNTNSSFIIRPSSQHQPKSLEQQKNNMQRLTLGIVTYNRLKNFYKDPAPFYFPSSSKGKKSDKTKQNLSETLSNNTFMRSIAVEHTDSSIIPQSQSYHHHQQQQQQSLSQSYAHIQASIPQDELIKKSDETFKDHVNNIIINHKKAFNIDSISNKTRKKIETPSTLLLPNTAIYALNKGKPLGDGDMFLRKKIESVIRERLEKSSVNTIQSIYHDKTKIIREIPFYKMNTNRMQMKEKPDTLKDCPKMSFDQLCTLGDYDIPLNHSTKIDILLVDEQTAIPYSVIISSHIDAYRNFTNIVLCHDFFDNFLCHMDYYQNVVEKSVNLRIIVFNIPGQAYTLFDTNSSGYNNEFNANIIDQLLYELHQTSRININFDSTKFIGFGYGANIISCYLTLAKELMESTKGCLLINPFLDIYDSLSNLIKKCINIFQTNPDDLPEMYNQFYSLTFGPYPINQEQSINIMRRNPIKPEGRIAIFEGCLYSINLVKEINEMDNHIIILHTLQNSIINLSHIYELLEYHNSSYEDTKISSYNTSKRKLENFLISKQKRLLETIDGSYNCFEENNAQLYQVIEDFIQAPIKESETAIFYNIERILCNMEITSLKMQERDINYINQIKKALVNKDNTEDTQEDYADFIKQKNEINAIIKTTLTEYVSILKKTTNLWNDNKVDCVKIDYIALEVIEQYHKNQIKRIKTLEGYFESIKKNFLNNNEDTFYLNKISCMIKTEIDKLDEIVKTNNYKMVIGEFESLWQTNDINRFVQLKKLRRPLIKSIKDTFRKLLIDQKTIIAIREQNNSPKELSIIQRNILNNTNEIFTKLIDIVNNFLTLLTRSISFLENLYDKEDNLEEAYLKVYFKEVGTLIDLVQIKVNLKNEFQFNNMDEEVVNKNDLDRIITKYQNILKQALNLATNSHDNQYMVNSVKEYYKKTQTLKSFIAQHL